jgi:hypothetical protein
MTKRYPWNSNLPDFEFSRSEFAWSHQDLLNIRGRNFKLGYNSADVNSGQSLPGRNLFG